MPELTGQHSDVHVWIAEVCDKRSYGKVAFGDQERAAAWVARELSAAVTDWERAGPDAWVALHKGDSETIEGRIERIVVKDGVALAIEDQPDV